MTTGTFTQGHIDSPSLVYKTWNGANGKDRENNYSLHFESHNRVASKTWNGVKCSSSARYYVRGGSKTGVSHPWTANDDLRLLNKLADEVRGHKFNLAVSAATGIQTVDMAVNSIGSLATAMSRLRRGDVGGALRSLGRTTGHRDVKRVRDKLDSSDLSGAWLAMQYGWLPTMSDVYEASRAFAFRNESRMQRYVVRTKAKKEFDSSTSKPNWSCPSTWTYSKQIQYELAEDFSLSAPRALGLTDPASVAWELLPWSFVIDWFLPIGDYISALNVIPFLKGKYWITHKETFEGEAYPISAFYAKCGGGSHTFRVFDHGRTCGEGALVVPTPFFNSIPDAMSPKRIYNAVALAHQKVR